MQATYALCVSRKRAALPAGAARQRQIKLFSAICARLENYAEVGLRSAALKDP